MVSLRLLSTSLLATFVSALACNSLLGIDAPNVVEGDDCVLTTDCRENHVCLFRVCSPPCRGDADCDEGSRCLATGEDTACVGTTKASCGAEGDEPCPEGTTCAGGVCRIECESPAEDSGSNPCLDGQVCADGVCIGTDATRDPSGGSCEPSEARCTSDGRQQVCSAAGVWGSEQDCPFVCRDGSCTGECVPEQTSCGSDGVTRLECDDSGQWQELEECPAVCSDGRCEDTCDVGTYQCASGDVRLHCSDDGVWVTDETCEFVCDAETRACAGECETGARTCVDDTLRICDATGSWDTLSECTGACIALDSAPGGHACVDCSPDSRRCASNSVQSCSASGTWQDTTDCTPLGQTCQVDGTEASCAGDCVDGEDACDGWDAVTCDGGTYVSLTDCDEPTEICRQGACEANTAYEVGFAETDGWSSFTTVANRMYAVPMTLSRRAELQSLRFAGSGSGVSAIMGLYADDEESPGDLIVGTQAFSVAATTNVAAPLTPATLEADRTYWVAVTFSGAVSFQQKAGSGYIAAGSFPTNPNPFPSGSAEPETNVWRLYAHVRDVPE